MIVSGKTIPDKHMYAGEYYFDLSDDAISSFDSLMIKMKGDGFRYQIRRSINIVYINIYLHTTTESEHPYDYIIKWFEGYDQKLENKNVLVRESQYVQSYYISIEQLNFTFSLEKIQEIAVENGCLFEVIHREEEKFEHGAGNFSDIVTFLINAGSNVSLNIVSNYLYDKMKENHIGFSVTGTIDPNEILNSIADLTKESRAILIYSGITKDFKTGHSIHKVQSRYCDYELELDGNQIKHLETKKRTQMRI